MLIVLRFLVYFTLKHILLANINALFKRGYLIIIFYLALGM
jgi:hypothetical protein